MNARYFVPATKLLHTQPRLWDVSEVQVACFSGYPENVLVDNVALVPGLRSIDGLRSVALTGKRHVDDGDLMRFFADDFKFLVDLPTGDPRRETLTFDGYLVALVLNRQEGESDLGRFLTPFVWIMPRPEPNRIRDAVSITVVVHAGGMITLRSGERCVWCDRPIGPIEGIEGAS